MVAGLLLALAPAAHAQSGISGRDAAIQKAASIPAVEASLSGLRGVNVDAQLVGSHWQVIFGTPESARAQVDIDVLSGKVLLVFTGRQAEFPLARGPLSGFARPKLNALWLWLPLTLIFVGAFFDRRRPWRLLHLDLAAVAVLGISYAFWMDGKLGTSVPLVYPTLAYVLVRMLVAGFKPRARAGPVTWLPARVLIVLTLALLALRIGLTLLDPFVSDIGYASVAGADRVKDGLELYTRGGAHFDTYGPLAYLLYIPFILVWPFHESQANPPAAQAAAILWDVLTVAGLVVLGRRLRIGWALALAWCACPFTALTVVDSTNDGLVAVLLVWAFVAYKSPALRGALAGAAAAAKIAPGFVLPVLARGTGRLSWRNGAICLVVALAVIAVSLAPVLPPGGLREFYDTTIGFQLHRHSPFSIWSQEPGLHWLQTLLKAASLGLAIALAFIPRGSRTVAQMAALAAAVLIAGEIPLQHWFYLYVAWFLPLYCLALFSEHAADEQPAA